MLKSTFSSLYSNNQYRLQLLTLLFQVVARSIYIVKFKTRLFQLRLPISKPIDFRIRAPLFKQSRSRFAFINENDEYLGSSMFIVCLTRMFVNAWFINADRIPPFTRCIYLHRSIVPSVRRGRN